MKVSVSLEVPESCKYCLFKSSYTSYSLGTWDCDYYCGDDYYFCGLNSEKETNDSTNLDLLRHDNPKCPFAKYMPPVEIDKYGCVIHNNISE